MTINNRNNLTENLSLSDPAIRAFNELANFFYSEQIEISAPECCYASDWCEDDKEYQWNLTNKHGYIGSLFFGRKHQYSAKKFYFYPSDDLDYDYHLAECVPEVSEVYLWTEKERKTILYSTSDARSECHTY